MPSVTYIFGDVLTGRILAEVPLYGVSMTRALAAGDFRGSLHLDQTGQDNIDLIASTEAGRCFVVCERDTVPIWDGFVASSTYQSQAKVMQIYAKSWEMYPDHRFMRSDFEQLGVEQRNIFLALWQALMATSNTPQITLPSSFATVVTKSLTVAPFEFKKYRAAMDMIANGSDGFDWTIDTVKISGVYVRTLRIGYPTLGASAKTFFEYPGNILNYWLNNSLTGRATNVFGLGAGEGSTMLSQEVVHADLLSAGFPRYDSALSFKTVTDADILTSLTTQAAIISKPTRPVLTVELKANLEPVFGNYGLGDAAQLDINDARHPEPSMRRYDTRIIGWEYYPPSSERVEEVRMVFQGEDL